MITVLYTSIQGPLPDRLYRDCLRQLPPHLQEHNGRFRRWQDRHANLFGKLLLLEGLQQYGFPPDCLYGLQYNAYARPAISQKVDFNISHSGSYVVCALTQGQRIGIDVEQIMPVAWENFSAVMTQQQWKEIHVSDDPLRTFFTYWTIKESVIKADSRGLSLALDNIHIEGNRVQCEGTAWYFRTPHIDTGYSCCLTCDKPVIEYVLEHRSFYV
jgi:4'-phosphopantetheinyl transferase